MAGRDINIPFGPDKTGGIGLEPIAPEGEIDGALQEGSLGPANDVAGEYGYDTEPAPPVIDIEPDEERREHGEPEYAPDDREASPDDREAPPDGGEAGDQGMDEMQMSILALKDSIGQGRELKAREKEREELAEALEADHIELADREDILANYHAIVAEQDAIIDECGQQRDAYKSELSRIVAEVERTQAELDRVSEQWAAQIQPLESDLGRVRATADQAKNDERSRKSELNAAESELRRADEADANTMAIARHQQVKAAYDEAHARSDQAKEQLAQVERAYNDAKQQAEQATAPLERALEDLNRHAEEYKENINRLGEEMSAARNRRQYCDTVYQYPDETAKMRAEVEAAEAAARQMDAENDVLREQLAASKQKARMAKVAIGIVIAIIVAFIITFIVVSSR